MAVIKYKDKNGKWKELIYNVNVSGDTSGVHVGDEEPINPSCKVWYDTSVQPTPVAKCKLDGEWVVVAGGGGSVGGGGASAVSIERITNYEQSVSTGDECSISFKWSTTVNETSRGNVLVYVNSVIKINDEYNQGEVTIPIQDFLTSGKTNIIKVVVRDIYGTENKIEFSVSVISISVQSSFKQNTILNLEVYPDSYSFPIVVKGGLEKTVHAVLNGVELENSSIIVSPQESGAQKYITLPSQPHGVYSLEIYATASIGQKIISSNKLYYELLWVEKGNTKTLIASNFTTKKDDDGNYIANQYEILNIPYFVYNATSNIADVYFEVNGELENDNPLPVGQKQQYWETSGSDIGLNVFKIISGNTSKTFNFNLSAVETVNVNCTTDEMQVCFIADNKHKNTIVETRDIWQSNGVYPNLFAKFNNFNWNTNGWTTSNGSPALNISGGASLDIPYTIFAGSYKTENGNTVDTDFKNVGGTIEIEFEVSNVTNIDTPFLTCMSNNRGIEITPQKALIKSMGTEVITWFKEGDDATKDDKMRISFVVTPPDQDKTQGIVYIYINGVVSGAMTYDATEDSFTQEINPVGISITSDDCAVNLFSIRVYRAALIPGQVRNNWIYDMPISEQVNAYKRNDIYDLTNGEILYNKLLNQIPCMTITGKKPSYKGDKQIVDIVFEGTEDGLYDFVLKNAQIDVQGTSSQYYPLKNWKFKSEYKVKLPDGSETKIKSKFELNSGESSTYSLGEGMLGDKVFCLKADYMETSSTHNTVTANIANDMYSTKTPVQAGDESGMTRTTIYGRPIVIFYKETEESERVFGGKFNFNYDKDAEGVFGFIEDNDYEVIECFEFCNNTSDRCLLHKSEYINKIDAPSVDDYEDYLDANGQIPEWRTDFETRFCFRPQNNTKPDYAYLKAVTDWLVSVDQTQATNKPLPVPYTTDSGVATYLYDENADMITFIDNNGFTRKAIDIGVGDIQYSYEEHIVINRDEAGNEVSRNTYYALPIDDKGIEVYSFTHDTTTYRLSKFKTELSEHFNKHFVLMYYLLTDILGMIDSRTKNMFWATWGERHEKHQDKNTDNNVIWYPIFYDMDTMLGLSNAGKMDIPYNVEYDTKLGGNVANESTIKGYYNENDGNMYESYQDNVWGNIISPIVGGIYIDLLTDIIYKYTGSRYFASGSVGFAYNGASNVLWNNVEDAFATELKALYKEKCSDGVFTYKAFIDAYEGHSDNWCESVYNEDAQRKYVLPFTDGYFGYTEDSTDEMVTTHPDYLYVIQGNRKYHRRWWLNNRFNYVNSKYGVNSYMADYITMRLYTPENVAVKPNADFTITTYSDQYVRIKYGSKTNYEICTHNIPTLIKAPNDIFNDTETIIYGASKILSIGDISDKYARSIDLSKASKLTEAMIGSDVDGYSNSALDTVNVSSNPMLQKLHVQNCPNLSGTLNVSACPIIKEVLAHNTSISMLTLPEGGVLEKATLPNTMLSLKIINHSNLNDFDLTKDENGKYKLESIMIEDTPIDSYDLVNNSPNLIRLRLTDIDWHLDDDSLLHRIKNSIMGLDAVGKEQSRPVLMGDCEVTNIKDYIKDEIDSYFNNDTPIESLPEFNKRDFRLNAKNTIKTHIVRFFNQPRPEDIPIEMDSGITDKRVIDEKFAEYSGATPLKSEDWAKTYEFANWGVYKDGELVMIEDLSSYEILEDTDFYAMYSETKKQFTVNYYDINFDTKEYGICKTDVFTYDECSVAEVLPDNYSHDEHTMRFSGWSALPNASESDISGGSIIIVNDGSPYVQDVYAVYWKDYKYRVKFIDYDNSVIIEEKIYYIGREPIVVPSDPIREHTTEYVFEFDGWICNDGEKFTEIPAVGGTVRSYIYKASYSYDWRPYVIKFINYDGTVLQESKVKYSYVPEYTDEIPEKPDTVQWDYTFDKWSPDITSVTGDATYTATYSSVLQKYKITWLNDDGSLIDTTEVEYGAIPEHEDATKPSDVQYTYVFAGWHIEPYSVDGEMTYKARYTNVTNKYLVTWENWDGSVLQAGTLVPYGEMPKYTGDAPTRPENQAEWYKFIGWDADVTEDIIETEPFNVVGHVTYRAWYEPIKQQYTITFKDYDGTIKYSELLDYGTPIIPPVVSREGYTFIGWGSEYTSVVNGDATYEAQYDINYYTIKFIGYTDFEGNTKEEIIHTLPYGSPVPTPYNIDRVGYNFKGWDREIPNIVPAEDVTINALYEIIKFTIKFLDYDGLVLKSEVVEYGSMPTAPTPTRTGFTFKGWDSSITTVSGDKTYTAQYEVSIYTITWVLGDHVETSQCVHGTTPTPPYQAGYVHTHRGVPLTLIGWHTSIVAAVDDVTYRGVMTGSLTPSLTLAALPNRATTVTKDFINGFLQGNSDIYNYISGGSTNNPFILYGLDFSALSEFTNIEFTDIKFTSSVRSHSDSNAGYFQVRFATDFTNIKNDYRLYNGEDYTGVGSGATDICDTAAGDTTYDSYVMNTDDFPGVLEWMNTYPDKVLRGKTEAVFGMVFAGKHYRCNSVSYQFNFKVS